MRSYHSLVVAFIAVNCLALVVALGLSGGVAFVSWLVPGETHEVGEGAPLVID